MTAARAQALDPGLRAFLLILASATIVVVLHWKTFAGIASMWSLMSYRHGYLIGPAVAYLLWQERAELGRQPLHGSWVGCVLLLGLTLVWLMAHATSVQAVEQVAVVLMIPALVLAALGFALFRAAAFALLLIVAAVPVGETLLPGLMTLTGDIAVWLLQAAGVPLYREGNLITVPSGGFQVATICAGLNYLLAGIVTAIVFARHEYRGWGRRLVFVGAAAAAFVAANGIRVFFVIFLHNFSDGEIFAHDHVWFGMVMFAATLILLLVVGRRFSDRRWAYPLPEDAVPPAPPYRGSIVAAVASVLIVASGLLLAAGHAAQTEREAQWPDLPVLAGCAEPTEWAAGWGPFMEGSSIERSASYDCGGHRVSLFVAVYVQQQPGREVVSSENELIPDHLAARGARGRGTFDAADGRRVGTEEVAVGGQSPELVWTWYSVGRTPTATSIGVKLLEGIDLLLFRRAPSVLYLVTVHGQGDLRQTAANAARALWDSSGPGRVGDAAR